MKSVCIIGAGPGGLVAAKTFLQHTQFKVTVFEKSDRIGGIWASPKRPEVDGYLAQQTPTNLSKFTVGFSDLSWQSLGSGEHKVPMFPTAAQVGQYLELYRNRYVPNGTIQFRHLVISADRVKCDNGHRWKVEVETRLDGPESGRAGGSLSNTTRDVTYFDHLVNAAGFFSKPHLPNRPDLQPQQVKVVHTARLRDLDDLFDERSPKQGKNILIYGGGNSAGEAACNIAFRLSSALYGSASPSEKDRIEHMRVCHVTPRPLYAVPPYVPGDGANNFMPLDLKIYDLKWCRPGPIVSSSGPLQPEVAASRYAAIHAAVGDQKDLNAQALVTVEQRTPYAALSESYTEFVRSGLIAPFAGRVTGYIDQAAGTVTAVVKTDGGTEDFIPDIVASVVANGYTPEAALSFLSEDIKHALEYDASSTRIPILLQNYQTLNPIVPDLGFIGFYEGPYWGVMEMQARLLAARWCGKEIPSSPDEELEKLRELRQAIKDRRKDVPQYWFSDYIGYLEEISRELGLERHDEPFDHDRDGPLSPARYLASQDNHEEAAATMKEMKQTLDDCAKGKFRARAAFRAMQGKWKIARSIDSARADMPSGTLSGTATFHPRVPSSVEADFEYLYIENGTFTSGKIEMQATRRYVYRYQERTDTLSVWFIKTDDNLAVDYVFHELEFGGEGEGKACIAQGKHLCEKDFYSTDYSFVFRNVSLDEFEVRHRVKGPSKDYVSTTKYTRPRLDD